MEMNQDKMTSSELIDKIIEGMPASVRFGSPEEIEIKIALYVYVELGKMKSVDEKIYWANGRTAYKVIRQSKKDSKDIETLTKKRKLTCISLANLYAKVLNRLGIECRTIRYDSSDIHLDNIITLKTGRQISAGLQRDISNIKTNRKLKCFLAVGREDFLAEDILEVYLQEIGYVWTNDSFRENGINDVKNRIRMMLPREALAVLFGSDEIYKGIKGLDTSEAYFYYKGVIEESLEKDKRKKIHGFPCYTLDENKEPVYSTFCIFADTENCRTVVPYLYSKRYGRMMHCDLEKLNELQKKGLRFGGSRLSKGRKILEKYMKEIKMREKLKSGELEER